MSQSSESPFTRRTLLQLIGRTAGTAIMYETMVTMGYAAKSDFNGPIRLSGDVKGASVLILGAGIAGMTAGYELRKAGYKVQILEYNDRPGGRNWSLYGGDTYTELGGTTQHVKFAKGLYFNPGPWRLPYHHQGILYYCKLLNVPLEIFSQVNYNAYLHSTKAFGGQPKRYREVAVDFDGYIAELMAKATDQNRLDGIISRDEKDGMLQLLRTWGTLDKNYDYKKSDAVSAKRGYDVEPGGGLNSKWVDSDPLPMQELFSSGLWRSTIGSNYEGQAPIFQPIGGMGIIGKAFARRLPGLIKYNCKVTAIRQDSKGVNAVYMDTKKGGAPKIAQADWCICTIPTSILSQIPMTVGAPLRNAINSWSYCAAFKVGLQFKRRFWEEDDHIYGGISYTDQPISLIGYPATDYFSRGGGVLLGGYIAGDSIKDYEFEAMPASEMIRAAVEQGSKIHPQYRKEFMNGVAVAWHRVPWTLGCAGISTAENRAKNYDNLCAIDGRIVLAGEHCSRVSGWQEGAVLSALDTIKRLHQKVLSV